MDWTQLFEDHSIDWVSRGPNTKKGEISIRCPWCGDDDPSHHLGISLTTENWGCHRSPAHRGKSPYALVRALLGGTTAQAKLTVAQYSHADPETLDAALIALTGTSEAPKPVKGPLSFPPDFRRINCQGSSLKHWRYLEQRGFDDVKGLCKRYQLRCTLTGQWKDRIIVPFYSKKALVGWTARAIQKTINAPRYLSTDEAIKTTIFNEDALMGGDDLLFLVEGPFDALKMDYYGSFMGARATCVFGASMSIDQICILSSLRRRFRKVVILFDDDAVEPAFLAQGWLHAENVTIGVLPPGVKDPGEMTCQQVQKTVASHR